MKSKRNIFAYFLVGTAILMFTILLGFALHRLIETESEMRRNQGDNMLWALSRTQSSALLLDTAITRKVGIPQSSPDIERRYNVLLSRLNLLSEGPQARYLRDLGVGDDLVAEVKQSMIALRPQILGLSFGDFDTAAQIHDILAPLVRDIGLTANRSMVAQWDVTGARLDRQRAAILQVIISILAIVALGILFSVIMLRALMERQYMRISLLRERETSELYRGFVALMSHQFRTPLAIIDSAMQRVLRSGRTMMRSEIDQRARHIRTEIQGLTELIDATLRIVRLDAGQLATNPRQCDIEALLGTVIARQMQATPHRTINLHIGEAVPPMIETDPFLAEQILGNLVSNAVKYSPETEPVFIDVTAETNQICFVVRDNGIGIPEDEQDKLFGHFFRASTSQGVPGTGIGLSISRQLATLLGGQLSFVSKAGVGSSFTLQLPHQWKG